MRLPHWACIILCNSFFNRSTPASFCLFFLFSTTMLQKNCRLQWDSKLDCRSWRQARWPLDHGQLLWYSVLWKNSWSSFESRVNWYLILLWNEGNGEPKWSNQDTSTLDYSSSHLTILGWHRFNPSLLIDYLPLQLKDCLMETWLLLAKLYYLLLQWSSLAIKLFCWNWQYPMVQFYCS